jgi:chromosome segregation ATPase
LATANEQTQNKDAEISTARQEKAKLTDHFNESKIAAARTIKLLQEEQSKNKTQQDQVDKAESQIQDLKAELKGFQQKLELEVEAKEKEATRATNFQQELHDSLQTTVDEQNKSARESREHEQNWKECMKEANEQIEELCQTSKGLRARLVTAESDLETAAEQREELCAANAKIETLRHECDILRYERRELEEKLHGFRQDREAVVDAHDEAQPRQIDDAAGEADEALDSCHDHGADQTPREPTGREDEPDHGVELNDIAAFDMSHTGEGEIEESGVGAVVDGDDHDDEPSQHRSFGYNSGGKDNITSYLPQIEYYDHGNTESASHGNFDRAAVDQQRKARRRAKN